MWMVQIEWPWFFICLTHGELLFMVPFCIILIEIMKSLSGWTSLLEQTKLCWEIMFQDLSAYECIIETVSMLSLSTHRHTTQHIWMPEREILSVVLGAPLTAIGFIAWFLGIGMWSRSLWGILHSVASVHDDMEVVDSVYMPKEIESRNLEQSTILQGRILNIIKYYRVRLHLAVWRCCYSVVV